jgi:hypothetical protein
VGVKLVSHPERSTYRRLRRILELRGGSKGKKLHNEELRRFLLFHRYY